MEIDKVICHQEARGISRRSILQAGAALAVGMATSAVPSSAFAAITGSVPTGLISQFGFGVINSECVLVDKDRSVYGFGQKGIVYRVTEGGAVETFATLPEGSHPAGFAKDREGNFVYCCLGKGAVMRLSSEGKVSMLADRIGSIPLFYPNFPTYDNEGNLYVSLSSIKYDFHHLKQMLASQEPSGALVRIRPDGRGELIASGIFTPNASVISPAGDAIFVIESRLNRVLRIAISSDGSTGKPEIYSQGFPSIPDGISVDILGRLYVTCPARREKSEDTLAYIGLKATNQIIRIDTDGQWTIIIDDPASEKFYYPTNCMFGGPEMRHLYVANARASYMTRVELDTPGQPRYHQL